MTLSEMTETLRFRRKLTVGSSVGNIMVILMEKVGYNFKKTFRKASRKFMIVNSLQIHLCNRCEVKPHSSKALFCFEQEMCKSKTQPCSDKSGHYYNICEEQSIL